MALACTQHAKWKAQECVDKNLVPLVREPKVRRLTISRPAAVEAGPRYAI